MIQRIQTVFLFLAVLLNAAFFFMPLYRHALTDPTGWIGTGLSVALGFALLITLFSVFLFNNRMNQIRWIKRAMIFQVIALGICIAIFFTLGNYNIHIWDEALGSLMVLLALVLQYLAIHYIRKDENLVRSMDRLR